MASRDLPSVCACTMLRKASRAMTRFYDDALAPSGLTVVQFAILRNLARGDALPLSRLADLLVMDRTSLYRTLAPLERAGWVEVSASGRGRAKLASVTAAGRQAIADATPAWARAQRQVATRFSDAEWRSAERLIGAFTELAREQTA